MKELSAIGIYEQTVDGNDSARQSASAIMGALANPPVYALLTESGQKLAQAAARALVVAEGDQRYEENAMYGLHARKLSGNFPLTHRFLEEALVRAITDKGADFDFDNLEADRMLVNGMQIQNEAMTFDRVANWHYNNDQDILLNGHQVSDIEDQKDYDGRLAAAQPLIEGKLGNTACPSCGGLNTSHPDACGRDPQSGELNGTRLALPRGYHDADLVAPLAPEVEAYIVGAKAAFEAKDVDLKSPEAVYLVNYTETAAREAGVALPVHNAETVAADVYRRAGMGEQLNSREMRGLGYSGYVIGERVNTPEVDGNNFNRNQVAAIGLATLAVDQIAYKTSPAYARLETMGLDRPAPGAEVARALSVVARDMDTHVKDNATLLLTAVESQYAAKMALTVFNAINNRGDDREMMAKIEAAEPNMTKSFKYVVGDNQAMQELETLAKGKVDDLDAGEREHYNQGLNTRRGISSEQVALIDKALERPPVQSHNVARQAHLAAAQSAQIG